MVDEHGEIGMLGLKIAVTGAVLVIVTGVAMHAIGKKMPSMWVALPILAVFFGGLAATVGGFLWWVCA